MSKSILIEHVADEVGLTKADAKRAVEASLDLIAQNLVDGGRFAIAGFGTFSVTERSARMGRNPQTGEAMQLGPSKSVKFKPSSGLKGRL